MERPWVKHCVGEAIFFRVRRIASFSSVPVREARLLARLSEADQESLAAAILAELEAEGAWDQAFLRSEAALGRLADEALDEYRARRTKPADPDRS